MDVAIRQAMLAAERLPARRKTRWRHFSSTTARSLAAARYLAMIELAARGP